MRNFIQEGEALTLTAPYAVTSGGGCQVGTALFGIATADAANGASVTLATEGVFEITKLGTDVVAVGDVLYWDNTNKRLTTTSTNNLKVGVAVAAAGNGVTTVQALIAPGF